tara:strand:- start:73 stop:876 length:804 start_codon:yes stop_codon:yes gene_type:complete
MNKILFLFLASLCFGCVSNIPEEIAYRANNGAQNIVSMPVYLPNGGESSNQMVTKDFKNQIYMRDERGCGNKGSQVGNRYSSPVLAVVSKKNMKLQHGHFDCSTQNTIWIANSENIILDDVSAWNGSDNALEIRNSKFILVKNSVFGKTRGNKCIETENSIVIFYNVVLHDCIKAFAGERTSRHYPELILFLNSKVSLIPDHTNYTFVCDSRVPHRYGLILVSKTIWSAKNVNCPISSDIPDGLIDAILKDDLETIRKLIMPIYEKL